MRQKLFIRFIYYYLLSYLNCGLTFSVVVECTIDQFDNFGPIAGTIADSVNVSTSVGREYSKRMAMDNKKHILCYIDDGKRKLEEPNHLDLVYTFKPSLCLIKDYKINQNWPILRLEFTEIIQTFDIKLLLQDTGGKIWWSSAIQCNPIDNKNTYSIDFHPTWPKPSPVDFTLIKSIGICYFPQANKDGLLFILKSIRVISDEPRIYARADNSHFNVNTFQPIMFTSSASPLPLNSSNSSNNRLSGDEYNPNRNTPPLSLSRANNREPEPCLSRSNKIINIIQKKVYAGFESKSDKEICNEVKSKKNLDDMLIDDQSCIADETGPLDTILSNSSVFFIPGRQIIHELVYQVYVDGHNQTKFLEGIHKKIISKDFLTFQLIREKIYALTYEHNGEKNIEEILSEEVIENGNRRRIRGLVL